MSELEQDKANAETEILFNTWVRGYQDGAASTWQPIETVPRMTRVLLWDHLEGREVIDVIAIPWGGGRYTHWQPLPEPPK